MNSQFELAYLNGIETQAPAVAQSALSTVLGLPQTQADFSRLTQAAEQLTSPQFKQDVSDVATAALAFQALATTAILITCVFTALNYFEQKRGVR